MSMPKFCIGDLVSLHDDELCQEPGIVTDVREVRYSDHNDVCLSVVSAVFGDECLTFAARDFVLLKKLPHNA